MKENIELTVSEYIKKSKILNLDKCEKNIRIAILPTYTINGLAEIFQVKCRDKRIDAKTYVSNYNQTAQEILNEKSDLYKFQPNITILFLDTKNALGDVFFNPYSKTVKERKDIIDKKIEEIINLSNIFVKKSNSKLIITNFSIPSYSPYGISETKSEFGLVEMVNELNTKLNLTFKDNSSIHIHDFNGFVHKIGENNIFDPRYYYFGDIRISLKQIPNLAENFMGYILSLLGKNRKCIVLDLDNTLWGGIIGEDGMEKIKLGPTYPGNTFLEFQKYLLGLNQRGIILAINSKNNFEDAIEVIKNHPYMILKEENFSSIKINWENKITNIKEIASELNIGLDSIVFFDDDPVNRELMKKILPEVLTVDLPKDPSFYSSTLMNLNDFNVLKITDEDSQRGKMYYQQRKRTELKSNIVNLEEYLKELGIKITLKKADKFSIPRISQLILKTNQFNLTTRRYQEEEIEKFVSDEKFLVGSAQVTDKFGDSGITGTFVIKKTNSDEWLIDIFLLSCRIMGRGIESAMMSYILTKAKTNKVKKVKAEFIPTKKNKPSENFLQDYGFIKNNGFWEWDTNNKIKMATHLEVVVNE